VDGSVSGAPAEISGLSGELTSRNNMCDALTLQLKGLTAALDQARMDIAARDVTVESLKRELDSCNTQLAIKEADNLVAQTLILKVFPCLCPNQSESNLWCHTV
jgi:chromosome segregation ATPase